MFGKEASVRVRYLFTLLNKTFSKLKWTFHATSENWEGIQSFKLLQEKYIFPFLLSALLCNSEHFICNSKWNKFGQHMIQTCLETDLFISDNERKMESFWPKKLSHWSNWLDIQSHFLTLNIESMWLKYSLILLLGIPGRILVSPVTQLFRSKWLHFSIHYWGKQQQLAWEGFMATKILILNQIVEDICLCSQQQLVWMPRNVLTISCLWTSKLQLWLLVCYIILYYIILYYIILYYIILYYIILYYIILYYIILYYIILYYIILYYIILYYIICKRNLPVCSWLQQLQMVVNYSVAGYILVNWGLTNRPRKVNYACQSLLKLFKYIFN